MMRPEQQSSCQRPTIGVREQPDGDALTRAVNS
jgi:hypothetical protein